MVSPEDREPLTNVLSIFQLRVCILCQLTFEVVSLHLTYGAGQAELLRAFRLLKHTECMILPTESVQLRDLGMKTFIACLKTSTLSEDERFMFIYSLIL